MSQSSIKKIRIRRRNRKSKIFISHIQNGQKFASSFSDFAKTVLIYDNRITLTYFRTFNSIKSASKKAVGLHSIQILGGIERVYQRQVHKRYLDWFIKMRGGIDENKMTTLKK